MSEVYNPKPEAKTLLESKTWWAAVILAAVPHIPGVGGFIAQSPELYNSVVIPAIMVTLRWFTNKPVRL
jgi:hypothetical protein